MNQRQPRSSSEANSMLQQSCKLENEGLSYRCEAALDRLGRLLLRFKPSSYRSDKFVYDYLAAPHAVKVHRFSKNHSELLILQYLESVNEVASQFVCNCCSTTLIYSREKLNMLDLTKLDNSRSIQ